MVDLRIGEKLARGEPVFGTFVKLNAPAIVELLGMAGFDFAILDAEHGCFTHTEIENLVRAGELAGIGSVVRVADASETGILHALDAGASGVQVPSLHDAAQVRQAVRHARHHPEGERGLARINRSARYGAMPLDEYLSMANRTLFVAHVENRDMLNEIGALCEVSSLDVLFVGAADLSQSLGVPGELGHPLVRDAVRGAIADIVRGGKHAGAAAGSAEEVAALLEQGVRYIAWSSDLAIIRDGLRRAGDAISPFR